MWTLSKKLARKRVQDCLFTGIFIVQHGYVCMSKRDTRKLGTQVCSSMEAKSD